MIWQSLGHFAPVGKCDLSGYATVWEIVQKNIKIGVEFKTGGLFS